MVGRDPEGKSRRVAQRSSVQLTTIQVEDRQGVYCIAVAGRRRTWWSHQLDSFIAELLDQAVSFEIPQTMYAIIMTLQQMLHSSGSKRSNGTRVRSLLATRLGQIRLELHLDLDCCGDSVSALPSVIIVNLSLGRNSSQL